MMDWAAIQQRLADEGYAPGPIDGKPGAKTYGALLAAVAGRPADDQIKALGVGCAAHLTPYFISASEARLANFMGQACHETGGWRWLMEIWGPTNAQQRYEGNRALGNMHPGDGFRYRGRGVFQLTGRGNYHDAGQRLGVGLEDQPELVEHPDMAVWTACDFWQTRGLNALADAGQEEEITRRVNGGTNGTMERRILVARAKALLQ